MEGNAEPPSSAGSGETLVKQSKFGAHWLFGFAAISIVNALLQQFNIDFAFSFGFGSTELVYAVGRRLGSVFIYLGSVVCAIIIGALVFFGLFAAKQKTWAFIGGLILVGLDLVLLVGLAGFEKLLSIVIHICAIVALWRGMRAATLKNEPTGSP